MRFPKLNSGLNQLIKNLLSINSDPDLRAILVIIYACEYPVSAFQIEKMIRVMNGSRIIKKLDTYMENEGEDGLVERIKVYSNHKQQNKNDEKVAYLYTIKKSNDANFQLMKMIQKMKNDTRKFNKIKGKGRSKRDFQKGRTLYNKISKNFMQKGIAGKIAKYS